MTRLLSRVFILLAVCLLPLSHAFRVAGAFGRQQYRVASTSVLDKLRAVIKSRLGLETQAAEELVKAIFERGALEQLEGGAFRFKSKKQIERLIEIRGLQHLDHALEQGRGCILYSGHFRGRWSFVAKLGLLGYHPLLIRQNAPPNMSRIDYWFQHRFDDLISTKFDCRYLWVESPDPFVAIKASAHLRKNGVLITFIDISSYTTRVVEVDFLNRKEPFPEGTVVLAQRSRAQLLNFSIHYCADQARYVGEIAPAHTPVDNMVEATQQLATRVESSIVARPGDWGGWQKSQYLSE